MIVIDNKKVDSLSLYLSNMQLVKFRTRAIQDMIAKKTTSTFFHTNIEFCVLQIRKILELIAFASLLSDANVYQAQFENIKKMWNATLILKDIERIHPAFYPNPIIIDPQNRFIWHDQTEPYLSRNEFVKVYDKCGKYLHEASPFLPRDQVDKDYDGIWEQIPNWLLLIRNLLNTHIVHFYNSDNLFYVSMGSAEQKPTGSIFTKVTAGGQQ